MRRRSSCRASGRSPTRWRSCRTGLAEAFCEAVHRGKPCLGVCLGLQLLFDLSLEDGEHAGLGLLRGRVVRFASRPGLKVPHMGWNTLQIRRPAPLLAGLTIRHRSTSSTPITPGPRILRSSPPRPIIPPLRGRCLARQPHGLSIPSREESGSRPGHVCELRRLLSDWHAVVRRGVLEFGVT